MEIDDDELMEVAIRDVSYQIKLHGELEKDADAGKNKKAQSEEANNQVSPHKRIFNPRKDPSIIDLKLTGLCLRLDDFTFRLEPNELHSLYDPVFEGNGSVAIEDASLTLLIECCKRRKSSKYFPVLCLRDFDFDLKSIDIVFSETGYDWFLNTAILGFGKKILSETVAENTRDVVLEKVNSTVEKLNEMFETNSAAILNLLGIHIDDLDEDISPF